MRITLRFDSSNAQHTTLRVFINGTSAGLLTMTTEEAASFHQIVAHGCAHGIDQFLSSREFYKAPDTPPDDGSAG